MSAGSRQTEGSRREIPVKVYESEDPTPGLVAPSYRQRLKVAGWEIRSRVRRLTDSQTIADRRVD
jgi:hypothetical protein